MAADDIEAALDLVDESVGATAPFDISPRGIRFRPGTEMEKQLEAVAGHGDAAVPALSARLANSDPLRSIVWLALLTRIGSPAAAAATDEFVERLDREDRWSGEFPGRREILLFLGRWNGA